MCNTQGMIPIYTNADQCTESDPAVRISTPDSVMLRNRCINYCIEHEKQRHEQKGFLKLCTSFAVDGSCGPGVVPMLYTPVASQIYHL